MIIKNVDEAINYLTNTPKISFEDSFSLAQFCSKLLRNKTSQTSGREIVIRVQDAWDKVDIATYPLWNDLCESAGLYPYLDSESLEGGALLRYEYHSSKYLPGIYLHEEQNEISVELQSHNSVVLSAPTSFGKSLLIEELIASKIYQNIVIIQPTLALLDETRKKLQKYKNIYNIIVSTNQKPQKDIGNVFLFTGERVVDYVDFPKIDFFVIDEFYKLSLDRDDDRAPILNHAFYKLLQLTDKFYFLGPNIKTIPLALTENLRAIWHKTNFATVAADEISLGEYPREDIQKELRLFNLLMTFSEPTLIYCSSPNKTMSLVREFLFFQQQNKNKNLVTEKNSDIVEWIAQNVHPNWVLIDALKNSIAFHNGALPRHLGSSIVDSFNAGNIKYLFCTSTLIEGVNTSAKNVVLYDKTKGRKKIDYFDYRNIAGRSGRMYTHFVGKVFNFHEEPKELELDVDIPIITQDNAPLELLIQINKDDLTTKSNEKLSDFNHLNQSLRDVIKINSGIPIEGQLEIVKIIETNLSEWHKLLDWRGYPTYDNLLPVVTLAWDHLLKKSETRADVYSAKQLAWLTMTYFSTRSISRLLKEQLENEFWKTNEPDQNNRTNRVTFYVLNVARHWFDYKLPKLLSVVSNLQKYVFHNHGLSYGDYLFCAQQLENGFVNSMFSVLVEYDMPQSAINKLIHHLNLAGELDTQTLIERIRSIDLVTCGLIPYEIKKIKSLLD